MAGPLSTAVAGPRLARTSLHEAGHCVMALRMGRTVERIEVRDDCGGVCQVGAPPYVQTLPNAIRAMKEQLLIILAGAIVEDRGEPVGDWWTLS